MGDRGLLRVAARRDSPDEDVTVHEEVERALRASGSRRMTLIRYDDDDHPFSSHRIALADALVSWLNGDCAAVNAARGGSSTRRLKAIAARQSAASAISSAIEKGRRSMKVPSTALGAGEFTAASPCRFTPLFYPAIKK